MPSEGVKSEKMPWLAKATQNQTHGSIMEAAEPSTSLAFSGSVGSGGCFAHKDFTWLFVCVCVCVREGNKGRGWQSSNFNRLKK